MDGQPQPEVSWYRDGEALEPRGHRLVLPDGALFFLRVTQGRSGGGGGGRNNNNNNGDAGTYWCVARNSAGMARSRNATLTVACKSNTIHFLNDVRNNTSWPRATAGGRRRKLRSRFHNGAQLFWLQVFFVFSGSFFFFLFFLLFFPSTDDCCGYNLPSFLFLGHQPITSTVMCVCVSV